MSRLRRLRFEKGMTINEVAEKAGISRATVMRLEAGSSPTARVARALADAYGVSVDDLMTPDSEPNGAAA